jgi:prepilin-type N-terminal cleavage/methylation domain-containing protein
MPRGNFSVDFSITTSMSIENQKILQPSKTRGFTVMEVVAAVAVMALLVSAALPELKAVIDRGRLNNEALALKLFLERAYVHTLTAREGLEIACAEKELTAEYKSGEVLARHSISRGTTLDVELLANRRLLLHPSIAASPATLTLRRANRTCQVVISLRGRVRVTC